MYCPEEGSISVPHIFMKAVPLGEVYVELLTSGQPAVSTMTVEAAGPADEVVVRFA
jgi:hypothetical protein